MGTPSMTTSIYNFLHWSDITDVRTTQPRHECTRYFRFKSVIIREKSESTSSDSGPNLMPPQLRCTTLNMDFSPFPVTV
eukprot:644426-Amphidinium_carterae.1